MKHNGVKVWAEFKYEKCLDFYYKCGIIGHGDKTCNFEEKTGTPLRDGQYGAWLKVGKIMASPMEAKREENEATEKVSKGQNQLKLLTQEAYPKINNLGGRKQAQQATYRSLNKEESWKKQEENKLEKRIEAREMREGIGKREEMKKRGGKDRKKEEMTPKTLDTFMIEGEKEQGRTNIEEMVVDSKDE